jgi:hypothetical protein
MGRDNWLHFYWSSSHLKKKAESAQVLGCPPDWEATGNDRQLGNGDLIGLLPKLLVALISDAQAFLNQQKAE